ncbi:MAG: collagenase [Colwellia sp.]|uniref:collagenase n=2 Tax=Colwellia sp. TaxID=56799 RepID=UPI0025C44A6B|nr:collagenase [Colwellia sp.]NQZ27148.1 collagenase [Colwellia sp.]
MINSKVKNKSSHAACYKTALATIAMSITMMAMGANAATVNSPPTADSIINLSKPGSHAHSLSQSSPVAQSTTAYNAGENILRYNYNCGAKISIRSESYITAQNLQAVCDELISEEERYHRLMKTAKQPLAGDNNSTVQINAFKDYASYQYNAAQIFGIDTNNGGMYLEGDPSVPGNQASYVTYITDDGSSWWIMNLSHEFNHYLDGRYNMDGNFATYMESSNNVVFWLEGSAEYVAWVDWPYDYARELAGQASYSLADVVNTTYEHDTGRIYNWGYLGVAFIFERHPEALDTILSYFRSGNYSAYNSYIQNFSYQNGSEWYEWLQCTSTYHDSANKECWDHTPTTDPIDPVDPVTPGEGSCAAMGPYSGRTSTTTSINIENLTNQTLQIRWLQEDGTLYSNIYDDAFVPGETFSRTSYIGDKWVVTDTNESCVELFTTVTNGNFKVEADDDVVITPEDNELTKASSKSLAIANAGDTKDFFIEVPADAKEVTFSIAANNGDADLYVKKGSMPTTSSYDCKSDSPDSNESCSAGDGEGTYFALVSAYAGFSGGSIVVDYTIDDIVVPTPDLVPDASCSLEGQAYSRNGTSTNFTINNNSETGLKVQWLSADGSRYNKVYNDNFAPGDSWSRSSYTGDRWIVTDQAGQCMKVITVEGNGNYNMLGDDPTVPVDPIPDGAIGCQGGIKVYPSNMPNSYYYTRLCSSGTGLPIISGRYASDAALHRTAFLLDSVMQTVDSRVVPMMVANGFRHGVMGTYPSELTTWMPEYSHLDSAFWDERARGLGGMPSVPLGSSAEENAMCHSNDRYLGEDITIHEYAHSLHLLGLDYVFPGFSSRLQSAHANANYYSLWGAGHYAMNDYKEYFAEGVQSFFNANMGGGPNTRSALQAADPTLYGIIYEIFGNSPFYRSCP